MELDLVSVVKFALEGEDKDLRIYLAKHIRGLRKSDPLLAKTLEELLKNHPARSHQVMRRDASQFSFSDDSSNEPVALPKNLIKEQPIGNGSSEPLLQPQVKKQLKQVIMERHKSDLLARHGLSPTRSLIFSGPPGVGKTMTAQWLSYELDIPLYTLDLTTVMSSFLGKTGNNLRSVIDYAKSHPSILLLDEIDAIAKKRTDESDVGELKRLVTIMLQELDEWPSTGLLVAATNHPELIDPALWRRFDCEIVFGLPTDEQVSDAIKLFSGDDFKIFEPWFELLREGLRGQSYSNIKREIMQLRRLHLLKSDGFESELITQLNFDLNGKSKTEKINFALKLVKKFGFTQQKASKIANVSRDTIRKRLVEQENIQ